MRKRRSILIGGGSSIREGIESGLQKKIQNEFKFSCNYAYKYFETDALVFVDSKFYREQKDEIPNQLTILAKKGSVPDEDVKKFPYLYLFDSSKNYWGKESLQGNRGVYRPILSGVFALTLAIALDFNEIFLLGMDFGNKDPQSDDTTHFYQDKLIHRGVGVKTSGNGQKKYATVIYKNSPSMYYDVFSRESKDIKIWNVSTQSKIENFPKISYQEFYEKLKEPSVSKSLLEEECKVILNKRRSSNCQPSIS